MHKDLLFASSSKTSIQLNARSLLDPSPQRDGVMYLMTRLSYVFTSRKQAYGNQALGVVIEYTTGHVSSALTVKNLETWRTGPALISTTHTTHTHAYTQKDAISEIAVLMDSC